METDGSNTWRGEIEEIVDEVEERFERFKNFTLIGCDPPHDHYFIENKKPTKQFVLGNTLSQKIEQEWKSLETNLPDSIYVRAYETRIDLMRAAIIGPPGTPYSGGLFFFDIFFPSNYPSRPPKLHYHSYGLNLNPNLSPEGTVSLSLLENWYGRIIHGLYGCNNAKWNPKHSSVLHVLVSIQRHVLNAKPYMDTSVLSSVFCESESVKYNKRAFLLTCEGMLRMLEASPNHFEVLVAGHFRKRAHQILLEYEDAMDESEYKSELFLNLFHAFERNGSYCKHHLARVKLYTMTDREARTMGWFVSKISE